MGRMYYFCSNLRLMLELRAASGGLIAFIFDNKPLIENFVATSQH